MYIKCIFSTINLQKNIHRDTIPLNMKQDIFIISVYTVRNSCAHFYEMPRNKL
jgi:hypothetical protein